MGRHMQLVMGPAGSGKSTYCSTIVRHCEALKRQVFVINLDPAAEEFDYEVSIDIRDLISLEDVMEELEYGPNGGLVYCMEYLADNLDWLKDKIDELDSDECYFIIDCPGQIELFTHIPVIKNIVQSLEQWSYRVCAVYLLDSQFVNEPSKFMSGLLTCLSCMVQLETPHINVLSKCDLLKRERIKKRDMDDYFDPDIPFLLGRLNEDMPKRFHALNAALGHLIDDYNMVSFVPLNIRDERSIEYVLSHCDNAIQYGEDLEVKEPNTMEEPDMACDAPGESCG